MQTVSESGFDNPTVEVAIYTEAFLADDSGRAAEQNTVMLLEQAFQFAEVNYQIHYDFFLLGYPDMSGGICNEPFGSFNQDVLDGNLELIADDSNMLLMNGLSGGCSNAPNNDTNACVVRARPMKNFDQYEFSHPADGLQASTAHDILHELSHNLGFPHRNHAGYGFNRNGFWWRTPGVGGNDMDNACGEFLEPRTNSDARFYNFFHWCTISEMDLPGRPSPTPPSEYPPTLNGQSPPHADALPRPTTPDDISILNCDIGANQIGPGETTTLFAIVENASDAPAQVDLQWKQDGDFLAATVVDVPANDALNVELDVDYGDLSAGGTGTTKQISVDPVLL